MHTSLPTFQRRNLLAPCQSDLSNYVGGAGVDLLRVQARLLDVNT